jgi:hypothetical protein
MGVALAPKGMKYWRRAGKRTGKSVSKSTDSPKIVTCGPTVSYLGTRTVLSVLSVAL